MRSPEVTREAVVPCVDFAEAMDGGLDAFRAA